MNNFKFRSSFTLLIVSFVFTLSHAQQTTIVAGKIENPLDFITNIILQDASLKPQKSFYGGFFDEKNEFRVQFTLNEPTVVTLKHSSYETTLYLEPGDSLYIHTNTDEFIGRLKFFGTSTTVRHNRFLFDYMINFGEAAGSTPIPYTKNSTPEQYVEYTTNLRDKKLKYFKKRKDKKDFTREFKAYFKGEVKYTYAEDLMEYPRLFAILNAIPNQPELPKKYFKFLKKVKPNKDQLLVSAAYRSFLDRYLNFKVREELPPNLLNDPKTRYKELARLAMESYEDDALYYQLASIFMDAAGRGRMNALSKEIEQYFEMETPNDYRVLITDTYKIARGLRSGSKAPKFTLEDINGNIVSLDDLKGKVVYLDFWATWCGPCLREIEPAKLLKEKFKGQEIVFLYITLDTNKDKWKSFVAEREMVGLHLFANGAFNTETAKAYNVTGVPTYFLINKNGIIVSSSPKRPSQPGIVEEIETIMELEER